MAVLLGSGIAAADTGRPLGVVTFNMFHGGPASGLTGADEHLDIRLDMVTRALRGLRPDIVGLQEASVGRGRGNVAERLAGALGMHVVHAPATTRVLPFGWLNRLIVSTINFAEGPAILSRFPITGHEVLDLPRCTQRLDPRVLLRAEIDSPWGSLHVFSTHIARDECQLRAVADRVRAFRGPLPAIVTGDFNMGEHLPGMAALRNGGDFVDAFRQANPDGRGATVWQRIQAPERTAFRRVDYVLVLPGTRVPGRAVASRVILDAPGQAPDGSPLWPSDHYGVMAEIDLRDAAARVQ